MIIILLFPIFDVIQQKGVGGNDDLYPLKVIEIACPDVKWAAKEGMPSSMVRCYHDVSLSHYGVDWPLFSHG
jgi:hypothetical protein